MHQVQEGTFGGVEGRTCAQEGTSLGDHEWELDMYMVSARAEACVQCCTRRVWMEEPAQGGHTEPNGPWEVSLGSCEAMRLIPPGAVL